MSLFGKASLTLVFAILGANCCSLAVAQTSQSQQVLGRLFKTSLQHHFFQYFVISKTFKNLDSSGKSYQAETTLTFPDMSCFPHEKYCMVNFTDSSIARYQQAGQWKSLITTAKSARPDDLRCTSYDEAPAPYTKITCRVATESLPNGLRDLPAPTSFSSLQIKEIEIVRVIPSFDAPERDYESRSTYYELNFSL